MAQPETIIQFESAEDGSIIVLTSAGNMFRCSEPILGSSNPGGWQTIDTSFTQTGFLYYKWQGNFYRIDASNVVTVWNSTTSVWGISSYDAATIQQNGRPIAKKQLPKNAPANS